MAPPPPHLDPSELGNKDYWQTTYTHDLLTQDQNPTHTGTTWFTDSNASPLTLRYLLALSPPLLKPTTTFLDLGTGNGEMLFLLRSSASAGGGGFMGRMLGVDYSPASVELAARVARQKGYDGTDGAVRFREWDILREPTAENGWEGEEGGFDVVLDKGTFDAISLNEETDAAGRRVCEGYRARVVRLVKVGGRFLVTSCNWTESELREWFEGQDRDGMRGGFEFEGRVEYPKFKFGGQEGQSVYGVCFRRV
ncbi:MAG: hypothetical protein LQ349_004552 [Xanthoria aureola]|nr:MAG: hypothetical protein LQ349_004552 [Xanthoria aureola]